MRLKNTLLIAALIFCGNCFAQDHGASQLKLAPIPDSLKKAITGFWIGNCTYQSETKEFTLDIKNTGDKLNCSWSIYQTGTVSQKIGRAGYDTASKQIVLDGFIFLKVPGEHPDEMLCKLARHTFAAEFKLARAGQKARNFTTEDVTFVNKDVKLAGTLYKPLNSGKYPAVVFLHGSGPATRWEWAPYFAEKFAEIGISSLIFDKRGCGESTGDWTDATLDDLSLDAIKGLEYLKTRNDIDPAKIGMWGFSNSGWVVSNAFNFSRDIAFVVCVSGGGDTPKDIELYNYRNSLDQGNLSGAEKADAMALVGQYLQYLSDGLNRDSLLKNINDSKSKTWYPYIGIGRVLPSAEGRVKWSWVSNWDPMPSIEKIKVPILLMFGEKDMEATPAVSSERWKSGLDRAGNKDYKIIVFKNANHGIRIGEHSGGSAIFWQEFAPGYIDTLMTWMQKIK